MYQPAEDSYLLQKYVEKHSFGRVLDMGTGSGIQALTAQDTKNVKEVIAVDIDSGVVKQLQKKLSKKLFKKITVIQSDLFENVEGQFNIIIFNPPYLPQDKGIEDKALYGGKKGWEVSERFFVDVSKFLLPDGKILFLFSSLTNKTKIDTIIKENAFTARLLEQQKMPMFEELYVYEITKTSLLRNLERKGIERVHYFTQGKRGMILTGMFDKNKFVKTHFPQKDMIKVAIKTTLEESEAEGRIENEIAWLKILNKKNIGPHMLFHGKDYFVYEFVDGEFILDWIQKNDKETIRNVLKNVFEQCFVLDTLGINKEEMHHPLKHILVDSTNVPTLIDFERCYKTDVPHNVTQFVEFMSRIKHELDKNGFTIDVEKLRNLAKEYKKERTKENLDKILQKIQ
ncbi:methyltransferase [Candidatus Woesearchaeota archaeon]|jgi:release factor glutamine methyltransferase|nr:methyltransferase [Candidatus Woesearchaeota archaeon]MBT5396662.1 methyltransferase [Candidatus Woesearchaeota archaeon]MBT5924266.1 methyltransferase [Candidatus Woesearchaeota archaeon]MBT6367551.1 methyltransferase [Candidatus Woesearchaeota archaeon]MBT7763050.1 methyltransferase [Candidatus Woesearchaeota archaeon]